MIEDYKQKVAAYRKDQEDIKTKANEFEAKRDTARNAATSASAKGGKMGLAISFFSVAVAIASICMVTKKKPLWFVALILAAIALTEMALAWTM